MARVVADRLSESRTSYKKAVAQLQKASRAADAARRVLERLERAHLDTVAADGNLDECLRAVAQAHVVMWHAGCHDRISSYLHEQNPAGTVDGWDRVTLGESLAVVPTLGELGAGVPEQAAADLLATLDRFAQTFDYPDVMDLELPADTPLYLNVTRSTGQATLSRFDTYRQDMEELAKGPLGQVLRWEDA